MEKQLFLSEVGERYRDFVVTKILPLHELQCTLRELSHEPTGAHVMHIDAHDAENLFCLSLRTLPSSSNGAPHILEHVTLCGSRKFPVKDPFFAMTRRSLNTFMNAMTGSDFTCYPAASQVEKDFYNLLDVYLDAVFHPELKKLSFLQEGHRLEFAEPQDPHSPLEFKGVVYNEMKGNLSSPDTRLWHALIAALVPDLPYAYNSGGDPREITSLTFDELVQFHKTYYHPSRCLFFFYGNLPLKKHLDFLAENALRGVSSLPPFSSLPRQERFKETRFLSIPYPISEGEDLEKKEIAVFGWLTMPLVEQEELLALLIIDSMMMNTDASLLKLPLLQSKLCLQVDSYIDNEMSEVPYALVCKGCNSSDIDALEHTLFISLEAIFLQGFAPHLIEAAIHQVEIGRTEIGGDHAPFGLSLFMRSGLATQHGCPPENALLVHSLFAKLRSKVQDPGYLPAILKKYVLDNPHRIRLIMSPDPHLQRREQEEEEKRLHAIQKNLLPEEISTILQNTQLLAAYQQETIEQDLSCLPKVTVDDVPPLARHLHLKEEDLVQFSLFHHNCFTNHFLYVDLVFDLPYLADDELFYAQLAVALLTEVGAGERNYRDNLAYIQAYTGGIGASLSLNIQATNPQEMKPSLSLRGKALARNSEKLLTLLYDTLTFPHFSERERIEELLRQWHTTLQNRLVRNALRYAAQLAFSGLSSSAYISNKWYGLGYFASLHKLVTHFATEKEHFFHALEKIKERLLCFGKPHLVLSCDEELYAHLRDNAFFGIAKLPCKTGEAWFSNYLFPSVASQARVIASPVAFTVEAYKTVSYIHPHAVALSVVTTLLDNKILHRAIREEGGAYGSGVTYNPLSGNFYFHSYRDPHIARTLKMFHYAVREIAEGKFTATDLEEAKLGILQQFDLPIPPGSRAFTAYSWQREGRTKELRQNFRDRLLALTPQDLQLAVEKDLLPKLSSGVIATFANKELLEKEQLGLPIHPIS